MATGQVVDSQWVYLVVGHLCKLYNKVLNKIKLRLEFCHKRGIYKYDKSMINV